jgi:hypothetical protein
MRVFSRASGLAYPWHAGVKAFLLALVVASACGPDVSSTSSGGDGPSTAARQTASADVRRILSGEQLATPTAGPTRVPRPACPEAIWWYEAAGQIGQSRSVQGPVVRVRQQASGGTSMLELGQRFPDPTSVIVVVASGGESSFDGKMVCVTGLIRAQDGGPTLDATSPAAIRIID